VTPVTRAALVALFAAVLVLPSLGQRYIVTGDEARFAVLAQDMLARHTWFDARVRDQRYRNKPLLYPWAIKALALPRGRVTETEAHLPIAAAAVAAAFFTALLGQQLFGARAGVWAGLVVATSYAFFAHSQTLLPDMIVVAFGVAALSAFWRSMSRPPGRGALVLFYAAVALGVFAKGPMGLLPVLVAGLWLLTEEGWRGLRRLGSWPGALAFVAVSGAWLIPYVFAGSRTFARSVLWEDWLAWYLGRPAPLKVLNFGLDFLKGFVPWTTLLILPLLAARREWRQPAFRFAFLACVTQFAVMALSQNHRARYLLPTYPAAALLVAWWADRHGHEPSRVVRWVVVPLSPVGALVALVVLALPWFDPTERALVDGFAWKATVVIAGGLALAVFACWALLTRRAAVLVPGLALGMAALLLFGVGVYTDWVNRGQDYRELAARIERQARGGEVGVFGGRFFSIDFYLGRPAAPVRTLRAFNQYVERPSRPVVVVSGRAWSEVQGNIPAGVEVLDTMRVRRHIMYIVRTRARAAAPR
jgi:4-amino-4-deoxy-L-arabinose transferase-like glycosyltransferase